MQALEAKSLITDTNNGSMDSSTKEEVPNTIVTYIYMLYLLISNTCGCKARFIDYNKIIGSIIYSMNLGCSVLLNLIIKKEIKINYLFHNFFLYHLYTITYIYIQAYISGTLTDKLLTRCKILYTCIFYYLFDVSPNY